MKYTIFVLLLTAFSYGQSVTQPSGGGGGAGTVTVVGGGSLTSTALVTGGGTTLIQTPSATATLDSSGNLSTPGSVTTGSGSGIGGAFDLAQGTLPAIGTTAISLMAPTSVTSYGLKYPGAAPSANQFLLWGAPSSGISTGVFTGFTSTNLTDSGGLVRGAAALTATGCIPSQVSSGSLGNCSTNFINDVANSRVTLLGAYFNSSAGFYLDDNGVGGPGSNGHFNAGGASVQRSNNGAFCWTAGNVNLGVDTCVSSTAANAIAVGNSAGDTSGSVKAAGYMASGGTKFTVSGCSAGTTVGGATAGRFTLGANGPCTVVITMNGATGLTAPNGWVCDGSDKTVLTALVDQSADSTTTCSLNIPTGALSGDVIYFKAMAY